MSNPDKTPLHPIERKVLSALEGKKSLEFDSLVATSRLGPDQVRRSLSWLASKGLVTVEESSSFALSASKEEPAELLLLERLEKGGGSVPMQDLKKDFKSDQQFSAAVGRASSSRWVSISSGPAGPTVKLTNAQGAQKLRSILLEARRGLDEGKLDPESKEIAADLLKRGLLLRKESKRVKVEITNSGAASMATVATQEYVDRLTPEIIASVRSSGREVKLRPIDVEAPASGFHPGRRHPVKEFINEVREVYLSMGFVEIAGDSIQSSFWNFDALFTPQDHPARELQDTFYVKDGRDQSVERKDVVAKVAASHEDGWKTGSKGWRYSWNVEEARRLVLRTHNTALTVRATMESGDADTRIFSVGRVYRNENLDFKHLAELHQMEGIVIGEGLNLRHLMGVLTKFYGKLGMSGVKLWPSYFPYTEPSMQVMVYYGRVGKWLEMGGSGIFRPEVTLPLGVKKPVLAWGCGLERLLMLRLGIEDIRELYSNDLEWLRERRDIASAQNIP
jgi:phenylalanyl-tRNA synthetase alpha chain